MPIRKDVNEEIGTSGFFSHARKRDTAEYDKYNKLKHPSRGSRVRHKMGLGEGKVLEVKTGNVRVKFDNGNEMTVSPLVLEVISE